MGGAPPPTSHEQLLESLDRMDVEGWLVHLAPDVVMRFANEAPVYGHAGCRGAAESLFASMRSIEHEVVERWEHGAATIVEAAVTFVTRAGDRHVIPMVMIYRTDARGLISDYRTYLDPSELWP